MSTMTLWSRSKSWPRKWLKMRMSKVCVLNHSKLKSSSLTLLILTLLMSIWFSWKRRLPGTGLPSKLLGTWLLKFLKMLLLFVMEIREESRELFLLMIFSNSVKIWKLFRKLMESIILESKETLTCLKVSALNLLRTNSMKTTKEVSSWSLKWRRTLKTYRDRLRSWTVKL